MLDLKLCLESEGRVPVGEHSFTSSVLFSGNQHPLKLTFSGFNYSRFLAVANFANINSNESFCPVGHYVLLVFDEV